MKKIVSGWKINKMFGIVSLYVGLSILVPALYMIFWSGDTSKQKKMQLDSYRLLTKNIYNISLNLTKAESYLRSWVLFSDNDYLIQLEEIWDKALIKNMESLPVQSDWLEATLQARLQILSDDLKSLQELHSKNGKLADKSKGISVSIPQTQEAAALMNASQVPLFQDINQNLIELIKNLETESTKLEMQIGQEAALRHMWAVLLVLLGLLVNGIIFYIVFFRHIKRSLHSILAFAAEAHTDKNVDFLPESKSEFGQIAANFNQMVRHERQKTMLATELSESKKIAQLSHQDHNDALYQALYAIDTRLTQINIEENKRNWQSQAIARFADMFRTHTNSEISTLSDVFLKNISDTLKANQAAIYLLPHHENPDMPEADYLEMAACYAWSRKKFLHSRHDIGEGMLGQCFLENQTYYLENLPDSFEFIKSGLGKGKPTCMLLCPVVSGQGVLGVLEIASLFPIENYQREFAEKMAQDLGATLVSMRK